MTKNVLLGLGIIAAGLLTILRRRRIASDSARRKETWMADYPDVDRLASSLGVIGWILVGFGLLILILGVTLARSSPGGSIAEFSPEVPSPAIRQDRLTEAVGFETLGGVFTAVLMPCALPCEKTEIFSTAVDNQQQIALHTHYRSVMRRPNNGLKPTRPARMKPRSSTCCWADVVGRGGRRGS